MSIKSSEFTQNRRKNDSESSKARYNRLDEISVSRKSESNMKFVSCKTIHCLLDRIKQDDHTKDKSVRFLCQVLTDSLSHDKQTYLDTVRPRCILSNETK